MAGRGKCGRSPSRWTAAALLTGVTLFAAAGAGSAPGDPDPGGSAIPLPPPVEIPLRARTVALLLGGQAGGELPLVLVPLAPPVAGGSTAAGGRRSVLLEAALPPGAAPPAIDLYLYALVETPEGERRVVASAARRYRLPDDLPRIAGDGGLRFVVPLDLAPAPSAASADAVVLRALLKPAAGGAGSAAPGPFGLAEGRLDGTERSAELSAAAAAALASVGERAVGAWLVSELPLLAATSTSPIRLSTAPGSGSGSTGGATDGLAVSPLELSESELLTSYRRLVGLVAGGARADALHRWQALERRALADDPRRGPDRLAAAWQRLLAAPPGAAATSEGIRAGGGAGAAASGPVPANRPEGTVAGSTEPALPLALLMIDLLPRYRSGAPVELSALTEERAARLAGWLAASGDPATGGPTTGDPSTAAALLTLLADRLQRIGKPRAAERRYLEARALDDRQRAALLGLGALHEKHGRPEAAIEPLSRLLELAPRHGEGRLRLALCLLRAAGEEGDESDVEDDPSGGRRAGRGERMLVRLAGDPAAGWPAALAAQELARRMLGAGRGDEAVAALRRGLARWPDHPELALLLAWALDEAAGPRGRSASSAEAARLRRLAARPGGAGDSERHRYNRWPTAEVEALRGELDRAAAAAGPALARLAAPGDRGAAR